jgi:hypothetical protein
LSQSSGRKAAHPDNSEAVTVAPAIADLEEFDYKSEPLRSATASSSKFKGHVASGSGARVAQLVKPGGNDDEDQNTGADGV